MRNRLTKLLPIPLVIAALGCGGPEEWDDTGTDQEETRSEWTALGQIYIDPSLPEPNTGENGSSTKPFNSWNDVTFKAGYIYRQKRGTTFYGTISIPSGLGTSSSKKIGLDAYGSGNRPRIIARKIVKGPWSGPNSNGVYVYKSVDRVGTFWATNDVNSNVLGSEVPFAGINVTNPSTGKWSRVDSRSVYYKPGNGMPTPGKSGARFYQNIHGNGKWTCVEVWSDYVEVRNFQFSGAPHHGLHLYGAYNDAYDILSDYHGNLADAPSGTKGGIGNGIQFSGRDSNGYRLESAYNEDNGLSIERISGDNKPKNIRIYYSRFHHNKDAGATIRGSDGVSSSDDVSHGEYIGCIIEYNGLKGVYSKHGVKIFSGRGLLTRNVIRFNGGAGIRFINGAGSSAVMTIENNLIYGNNVLGGVDDRDDAGIVYQDYAKIVLSNNTIVNKQAAVRLYYSNKTALVATNNIFKSTSGTALVFASDPGSMSGTVFRKNIIVGPSKVKVGSSYLDLNAWNNKSYTYDELGVDPQFVDEASGNFRLKSGSPAINAGVSNGITVDLTGKTRTGLPDIGAYEY